MKRFFYLIVAIVIFTAIFTIGGNATTYIVTTQTDPLTVHIEPQGPQIGQLPKGTKIDVISITGGWAKIKYNGAYAYVYAEYLQVPSGVKPLIDTTKVTPRPTASLPTDGTIRAEAWMTSSGPLNLRKTPSENGKVIGRISNGTIVYIVSQEHEWAKIIYENRYFYAKSEFLLPYEECAPAFISYMVNVPKGTMLNVRTGPGKNFDLSDQIDNNTIVYVSLIKEGWAKITYGEYEKTGYVQTKFIEYKE